MTKTTEEGPYRIEDAWSGSFKKGKVVGPSLSKEDIFPGTPETLCDMLNAAWLAGRSSVTTVPLSPEMVEKIMEVVDSSAHEASDFMVADILDPYEAMKALTANVRRRLSALLPDKGKHDRIKRCCNCNEAMANQFDPPTYCEACQKIIPAFPS